MQEDEINYSKHVETRIKERHLEKEWIVETILNPDKKVEKSNNEIHFFKKFVTI